MGIWFLSAGFPSVEELRMTSLGEKERKWGWKGRDWKRGYLDVLGFSRDRAFTCLPNTPSWPVSRMALI